MHTPHESPSPWLIRHAPLIPKNGLVLDLACGSGRNTRWLAEQGWRVCSADIDEAAIAGLRDVLNVQAMVADIENNAWPFGEQTFDGIVVCRYLHRPLLPRLAESLASGGVLIYETFMRGQEQFGRPKNPDFLLRPDELREVYEKELTIVAFEQGIMQGSHLAMMQRLCAIRNAG
ncbi:MAG: class I SAM-dependent methyltransferase [Methylobacillus sp.]|jgi:SAM-dependent methyltransferase|nr:class I SAM-dependent methyltransferase [Methylobacillus sp.]